MAVAPLRGPAAHRPDDRATDRHSHRRRVIHIVDDISITVVNPTKMLDMDSQPSLRSSTVRDWAGLAARIILGATLLVAGIIKATDIDSTIWSVRTYQIVPWDLAPLIGWTMPILEIVVGLMLIFGIATRWSGLLGTLAMVVFIVGISSVWRATSRWTAGASAMAGLSTEIGTSPSALMSWTSCVISASPCAEYG